MTTQQLTAAMTRMASILRQRPQFGLHDDAPATARWAGGTRVVAQHANGTQVESDMPADLGGSGDRVSPGWLFRAGLASCAATTIAMNAAAAGIELTVLEIVARSRSDTRGLLGMADADGTPVPAGPRDLELHIRIAAPGVPAERLRALVTTGIRCSPIVEALRIAPSPALTIDVDP